VLDRQQRPTLVAGLAARDRLDGIGPSVLFRRGQEDFAEGALAYRLLNDKVLATRMGRVVITRIEAAVGRDRRG